MTCAGAYSESARPAQRDKRLQGVGYSGHWMADLPIMALVIDPDIAAVLLAAAFAGVLAVPGLRKAARRGERFCVSCGRRVLLGQKTCDCDD